MKSKSETKITDKGKVIKHTIGSKNVLKRKTVRRKAVIQLSKDKKYYYELFGDNYKSLLTSEMLENKKDAVDVIEKYFPDFRLVDKTF